MSASFVACQCGSRRIATEERIALGTTTKSDVLVIIPAYNEAENLPHVLADLARCSPGLDVVVIDDASWDETPRIAAGLGVDVVSLPNNLGYGGALQTGFKFALERGYAYAVTLDADGQHDCTSIAALLNPVQAGAADVAIGSRFLGSVEYHTTWAKRLGMRLFGAVVAHYTGRRITDVTSGFQALNHKVLTFFARDNYPADYPDADMLLLLHYAGFRVTEVPVNMRNRLTGVSMHSSWKVFYYIFKMFLSLFIIWLRQKTRRRLAELTT
jgi:glycosyltransferase involved in cell wall biosynthesis